jgi:hypothetical protein
MINNTTDTPDRVITPTAPAKGPEVVKDNKDDMAPKEPDKWCVVFVSDRSPCGWARQVITTLFGGHYWLLIAMVDFLVAGKAKIVLLDNVSKDFAESKADQAMQMLNNFPLWTCRKCSERYLFLAEKDGD